MVTNLPAIGTSFALQVAELAQLFPSLQRRGYQVVGPTVRGSAIVYEILNNFEELPAGWTAEQEAQGAHAADQVRIGAFARAGFGRRERVELEAADEVVGQASVLLGGRNAARVGTV